MMKELIRLQWLVMLLAICTLSVPAISDERVTPLGPRVGEHLFSPLAGFPMPFIRTVTTANLGGGASTGMQLPEIEIGERIVIAPRGDLAVMTLSARHEQAIKSWMSFFIEARAFGRLGTNVASLLSTGVNTVINFDLGWNAKILENDRWSVAGGLTLRDGSATNIDVERWAQGLADSGYVTPENQLVDTRPSMKFYAGVRAAYAANAMFGLIGFVNGGVSEPITRDGEVTGLFDAGLALSVDWNPLIEIPIGTTVGLDYRELPQVGDSEGGSTKDIMVRIGYTGTDAFGLGLQAIYQFVPINGVTDQVTFITALLDFRFYF